jgi:hypothetical protein
MKKTKALKIALVFAALLQGGNAFSQASERSPLKDCWNHFQKDRKLSYEHLQTLTLDKGVSQTVTKEELENIFKKNFVLKVCLQNNGDMGTCLGKIRFQPFDDALDVNVIGFNKKFFSEKEMEKFNQSFETIRSCYDIESLSNLSLIMNQFPETLGIRVGGG